MTTPDRSTAGHVDRPESGVRGSDVERMDPTPGGVAGAGADGETAAREDLRQELGERSDEAGREG